MNSNLLKHINDLLKPLPDKAQRAKTPPRGYSKEEWAGILKSDYYNRLTHVGALNAGEIIRLGRDRSNH